MRKNKWITNKVPWKRYGFPNWQEKLQYREKWKNDFVNVGICPDRLFTDEKIINSGWPNLGVEERTFAMMWDYHNNYCLGTRPYIHILLEDPIKSLLKNEEDIKLMELTAQSIIQWLGTNVGSCFIDETRKISREETKRLKKIIDPKGFEYDEKREKEYEHIITFAQFEEETNYLRLKHKNEMKVLEEKHKREIIELEEKHKRETKKVVDEELARRKEEERKELEARFSVMDIGARSLEL